MLRPRGQTGINAGIFAHALSIRQHHCMHIHLFTSFILYKPNYHHFWRHDQLVRLLALGFLLAHYSNCSYKVHLHTLTYGYATDRRISLLLNAPMGWVGT